MYEIVTIQSGTEQVQATCTAAEYPFQKALLFAEDTDTEVYVVAPDGSYYQPVRNSLTGVAEWSRVSIHVHDWVYGSGDMDGRTWCRTCLQATWPRLCTFCGEWADDATVEHGSPLTEMHRPVFT